MTNLYMWAIKWNVPIEAMNELTSAMIDMPAKGPIVPGGSEAAVQSHIRLESSSKGVMLWRNNVGACFDAKNPQRLIRYGLANESLKMNERIKSSDLIGLRPVLITEAMVGTKIGQFVARECKKSGWKYTGTDREVAQLTFIKTVLGLGGDASFASAVGTL